MSTQTNIFDTYSQYFDLFQGQNVYSDKILAQAKEIKKSIQEVYADIKLSTANEQPNSDFWFFDFDVNLTQVSEQPEPSALKLFTRQYTPILRVYKNNDFQHKIEFDMNETKYIHKHINELFMGSSISQEYFFDIAQQYFLLDFVYRQIKNEDTINSFVWKVKESCSDYDKTEQTIICINCKLRGRKIPDKINPNIYSAICHINTLWDNLSKQSNFILIGNYKNYSSENELITLLNEQNIISEPVKDYFQNDFLLLNNMEFMHERPYTMDWNNRVFSPLLLEKKDDKYCLKDIEDIKKEKKQIFLFQKRKEDGVFYKTEMYFPEKYMKQDDFIQTISLSNELLKLKQQEEK